MKQLICLGLLTLVPVLVFAQKNFDEDVNSELDKLYQQNSASTQPAQVTQAQPVIQQNVLVPQNVQAAPAQAQQVQMQQPQIRVQTQPTTVIEAAPLKESRAEQIRKARQEAELMTEQKIVEKLETSRMEDERKRAEVLFGDKFNQMQNPSTTPAPVVQQPPVTPVAQPVPVVVTKEEPKETLDRSAVRQEVTAALDEAKAKEDAMKKPEKKTYFSVLGGLGDYYNRHIQSKYSIGFGFGQKVNDHLLAEGQFIYARYYIEQEFGGSYYLYYPRVTNMDQYQGSAALKYQFLNGVFKPAMGGVLAYTYRKYEDIQNAIANSSASSHAIDVGFTLGADVEISDSASVGLEYRYMHNITNQAQADSGVIQYFSSNSGIQTPEQMNNSMISLTGRMNF